MTAELTETARHGRLTSKQMTSIFLIIIVGFIFTFFFSTMHADYSIRASAARGLQLATEAKTAVTDYYAKHKAFPENNAAAGLPSPSDIKNKVVESVEINTTGSGDEAKAFITITYNQTWFQGKTIVMSITTSKVNDQFGWDCTGGTLATRIRPGQCWGKANIEYDLNFPSISIGILPFVFCFFFIKAASVLLYKKYSVFKFFLEVAIVVILFEIIDGIYQTYYVDLYLDGNYWDSQIFIYFIGASILNIFFEPMCASAVRRMSKVEKQ